MAPKRQRQFKIVQTASHFLYLPLYYAHENNYFGRLPSDCRLSICNGSYQTDRGVYRQLMDTSRERDREIVFAVCDPGVILTEGVDNKDDAAVLARLVTNAAFWAIDHRSRVVRLLSDLGEFDKVIAYHPGSTSYAIAQRAFREAGKVPAIHCVEKDQLFTALKASPSSWTALSPELLDVEYLVTTDSRFGIDLVLGKTPEYSELLVTALLSRSDFVHEHRDIVLGLLEAMQTALVNMYSHDPIVSRQVIDYAVNRFQEREALVSSALQKVRDAQLFPISIDVREPDWLNVARVVAEGAGKVFDHSEAIGAKDTFAVHVEPYQGLVAAARAVVPVTRRPLRGAILAAAAMGGIVLGVVIWSQELFAGASRTFASALLMICGVCGVLPHLFGRTRRRTLWLACHWLLLMGIVVPIWLWGFRGLDATEAIAFAAAFSAVFFGYWVERLLRLAERDA